MEEIWRDIPCFEGLYQASNLGRVRSLDRRKWNGHVWYIQKGRILSQNDQGNGYLFVNLFKDGKHYARTVHRLVASAFLGESDLTVNHINENKHDNRLDNLEYMTLIDNMNYGTGKARSTANRPRRAVESYDLSTGRVIKVYKSMNDVVNDGFRQGCVCNCCRGASTHHAGLGWRYLTKGV